MYQGRVKKGGMSIKVVPITELVQLVKVNVCSIRVSLGLWKTEKEKHEQIHQTSGMRLELF